MKKRTATLATERLRLVTSATGLLLDDGAQPRKEDIQVLGVGKRSGTPLQAALRVAAHEHHPLAGLPHRFDAPLPADPHHPLAHADGPKGCVLPAAPHEHDDALADFEGRLALDAHGEVADVASERFDDDLALAVGAASEVALDLNPVPGA